ncbi:MAG TPA: ATP-binding protein [Steroidobacteraceae bacterium]|jgi:signal transduction histidine kinase|nr:ATP-binding protein [Steroidobacteraceae bacterium]
MSEITPPHTHHTQCGVDAVIITDELKRRPSRAPDFESENRVLLKLANTMAQDPRRALQELVDSARELCRAGSAGISLLDPNRKDSDPQFRWVATSGEFSHYAGNTVPRHFSPCGTVLDRNHLLMMADPVRHFPYIDVLSQPVPEVLLVPFHRGAHAVGTVWVAAHAKERHFDGEDARLVASLAQFAEAAVQVMATADINRELEEAARLAAERELQRLAQENRRITALIGERESAEEAIKRELKDTRLLRDVAARLIGEDESSALFDEILAAAITITEADAGTIQLLDGPTQTLTFLSSRGFTPAISAHFARIDADSDSPCGIALSRGERTFVEFTDDAAAAADSSNRLHYEHGLRCAQSTPLLSRSGRKLGMFSTHWRNARTLTERELQFLDLLGRQAADLIERSQAREALRDSERELRETDRRKDEFLAVLAHELRNPLVPIRTGIELLKRVPDQPALVEKIRPMMDRQVRHVVRLIDDLLDVSRIATGKIALQRQPVVLSNLVNSVVEANRSAIAAAGLKLEVQLDDPQRILEVDPTRLSQVIGNILHNATKFTPEGGTITLRADEEPGNGASGRNLVLRISDTGIGIHKDLLPTIFGLFTQVHSDSFSRYGGLGIGLALARKLVELHGGWISATSPGPGLGTEFIVTIPATLPHLEAVAAAAPSYRLDAQRILVVDDNADAADSTALLIAQLGGEVKVAYDGMNALEMLRDFDASLVLLDIGMPGLDGYETCVRMRREKGDAIRIVAVTGWGQEEDRRRAAEAGFDAHLTKPVNPAHLAGLATGASSPEPPGQRSARA